MDEASQLSLFLQKLSENGIHLTATSLHELQFRHVVIRIWEMPVTVLSVRFHVSHHHELLIQTGVLLLGSMFGHTILIGHGHRRPVELILLMSFVYRLVEVL